MTIFLPKYRNANLLMTWKTPSNTKKNKKTKIQLTSLYSSYL